MALLGESVVEEWLNRDGYFTIRGTKLGVHEIDLLAVKLEKGHVVNLRHIECQISFNPVSWITHATKEMQTSGWKPNSTKARSKEVIESCVSSWIEKKFLSAQKNNLRQSLCSGTWSRELVLGKFKYQAEVDEIQRQGVVVIKFGDILNELMGKDAIISRAAGGDIFELMHWLRAVEG